MAAGDLDSDGQDEIIVGAGGINYGSGPNVRIYKMNVLHDAIYAYRGAAEFGVKVGVVVVKNGGR